MQSAADGAAMSSVVRPSGHACATGRSRVYSAGSFDADIDTASGSTVAACDKSDSATAQQQVMMYGLGPEALQQTGVL